jgi:hypothetical protein
MRQNGKRVREDFLEVANERALDEFWTRLGSAEGLRCGSTKRATGGGCQTEVASLRRTGEFPQNTQPG